MVLEKTTYNQDMTENYESYKNRDLYRTHRYLGTNLVFDELQPVTGKTILDFGCGSGYEVFALAQAGAKVTGIDHSADQISFASKQHAHPNATYLQLTDGVLDPLIAAGQKFDFIISNFVFCAIEDDHIVQARIREFKPLLADDGKIIILSNNPEENDGMEFISWDCKKGIIKDHGAIFQVSIHAVDGAFDVNDFYREDAFYSNLFEQAGLHVDRLVKPVGSPEQADLWLDEVKVAPTVIFIASHAAADRQPTEIERPVIRVS